MHSTQQPEQPLVVVSDHSRIACAEDCMRKRYFEYHYKGIGLEHINLRLDLFVGFVTHAILADLLTMLKLGNYSDGAFQTSIMRHLADFERDLRDRGLELELASGYEQAEDGTVMVQPPSIDFTIELYSCWIRNSVTAWAALRAPYYVSNYRIISIEQEWEYWMADGGLLFLSRPDAVLQRLVDGAYFVLNFKTVGEPNQWWQEQWPHDMQTLSEVLPIEAGIGQRVSGVLIEGLVKGSKKREYPRDSGQWWLNSPLCWPWHKPSAPPFPAEYAAKWKWVDEDGRGHTLGKGYTIVPAWETELGVEGWLQWLMENARDVVEQQFVALPPILRQDAECESWIRQTTSRELTIANYVRVIDEHLEEPELVQVALDKWFPQSTSGGNCIRPSKCQFYDICWGNAGVEPQENGYQFRTPNHPRESEYLR